MAAQKKEGRIPANNNYEWKFIKAAKKLALKKLNFTISKIQEIPSTKYLSIKNTGVDKRVQKKLTDPHSALLILICQHFKIKKPGPLDVKNILDSYRKIRKTLRSYDRDLFRLVSEKTAKEHMESGGDFFGYVIPGDTTIYLNEVYFVFSKPTETGLQTKPYVSPSFCADALIHEIFHVCYSSNGVIHRALTAKSMKVSELDNISCESGYTQVKTNLQAMGEAYVFHHFSKCVYQQVNSKK